MEYVMYMILISNNTLIYNGLKEDDILLMNKKKNWYRKLSKW